MRMSKDLAAGELFIVTGGAFLMISLGYPLGTSQRLGAGAFPAVLAAVLVAIGLATAAKAALVGSDLVERLHWQPLVLVIAAFALFGALLERAGLPAAAAAMVLVAGLASRQLGWRAALLLAIGLAAFATLAFVTVLGLPIPIRGPWLGG